MTDNKKSALEQLREICASLNKVLENAPSNCEKPELEVTVGALHIACLLELAEKVEQLEAKRISFTEEDKNNLRAYLNIKTNDARTIELPRHKPEDVLYFTKKAINHYANYLANTIELPDDTFDRIGEAMHNGLPIEAFKGFNRKPYCFGKENQLKIGSTTFIRAKKESK